MPYTLNDIAFGVNGSDTAPTGGVWALLSQRQDLIANGIYQWIGEALLEMSRNFRFQGLERTGPEFTLIPHQVSYAITNFVNPADLPVIVNLIPSFFRYFSPLNSVGANAGSTLAWKTINALELMFNTPGVPTYFTRYQDAIWVAPRPNQALVTYMRYQIEHPFSMSFGKPEPSPDDAFLLPNEWKDIIEFAAAQRGAVVLRMLDYAGQYHNVLYGDPEFQRSSGGRGNPGLIHRRISQMEGDSTSMMKQIRVEVRRT